MRARLSGSRLRLRNGRIALAESGEEVVEPPTFTDVKIGMIGQSNMANMPITSNDYPLGDIRSTCYTRDGVVTRIGNYNDNRPAGQKLSVYGSDRTNGVYVGDGFVWFANAVAAAVDAPVCLIERAVGGSSITTWQAGQTHWNAFAAAVTAAGGDIGAVIWYQGETDAHNMNPVLHRQRLANVHQQCMDLVGRNTSNFHFGIVTLGVGSYGGSVDGEFGAMRALLADYANTTPGAFLAATAHDSFTSDGVHLVGSAFGRVGRRAGKSLAARFGVGTSGAGPRIVGAAWDGSGVVLTVQHTGGTGLMDGAGGNGTALTGFEFKDAGGMPIAHTGSSIASPTAFRFALPSIPATVSYAMMNTPHGASSTVVPTFASIPCDNALYFDSTVGCPLQPCAAIAVN